VFSFSKKECEKLALNMAQLDLNDDDEKKLVDTIYWNAMDCLSEVSACVCVCVCVCVNIYIYMCVCVCVCVNAWMCVCVNIYCISIYMSVCERVDTIYWNAMDCLS
jgi:hypothetical protein